MSLVQQVEAPTGGFKAEKSGRRRSTALHIFLKKSQRDKALILDPILPPYLYFPGGYKWAFINADLFCAFHRSPKDSFRLCEHLCKAGKGPLVLDQAPLVEREKALSRKSSANTKPSNMVVTCSI